MVRLVFVTTASFVPMHFHDDKTAQETIETFIATLKRVSKENDELFFTHDSQGNKVAMVRCSQVVGFYLQKGDPQADRLDRLTKAIEKSVDGPEEHWKGGA